MHFRFIQLIFQFSCLNHLFSPRACYTVQTKRNQRRDHAVIASTDSNAQLEKKNTKTKSVNRFFAVHSFPIEFEQKSHIKEHSFKNKAAEKDKIVQLTN